MKLRVPEWLYLDPTKPRQPDERDSWGYPKNNPNKSEGEQEADTSDKQDTSDEVRSAFTIRHAGMVAVDLVRRGWNYQGNGVVTAGINNLQYRQPEVVPVSEDVL